MHITRDGIQIIQESFKKKLRNNKTIQKNFHL